MKKYSLDELKHLSKTHPIIAFDGVCNMCNGFVQWLIRKDKKRQFRYTTLQSEEGSVMRDAAKIEGESVILFHQEKIYVLSDVGLKCMELLGGGWSILSWLSILPSGFRNAVYHWIARNRYRLFGKRDTCMVPSAEIRALFL